MPDDIRRRLQRIQRRVGRYWNELLVQARDAGAIRSDLNLSAVRMLILGALNWTAEWYQPRRADAGGDRVARDRAGARRAGS